MASNAWVRVAGSNGTFFTNSIGGDLVFYTGNPGQRILLGTSNGPSMIVVTSNAVGVGKSNPGYPLDINGDLNFTGTLRQNGSAYVGSQWSNTSSNVFIMSSNIAIGKSNAAYPLDVVGDINFTGVFRQNGTPYVGSQWSNTSSNVFIIGSNIGIGLSNPQYPLTVNGDVGINGNLNLVNRTLTFSGITIIPDSNLNANITSMVTSIPGYSNEGSNLLLFISSNSANDYIRFMSSNTEKMRLTGQGNLGIGLSNPQCPFDVIGDIGYSNLIKSRNGTNGARLLLFGTDTTNAFHGLGVGTNQLQISVPSTSHMVSMGYTTSGTFNEVMRVQANGLVGIGSNPSFVLDVKGNATYNYLARFTSYNSCLMVSTGDVAGRFNPLVKVNDVSLLCTSNNTADTGGLLLGPWATGAKGIRIDGPTGYVGVGLSNPAALLHVNGDAWANKCVLVTDGTSNAPVFSWSNDTNTGIFHPALDQMAVSIAGSNMLHMTSSNVGIATSNPSYTLHVTGSVYATGDILAFSDARKKTNVCLIENAISKIDSISGYTFEVLKEFETSSNHPRHTGLLAQELETVLPEAVYEDGNGYKSIAYGNVVGLLVQSIKEMKRDYEARLSQLEAIISRIST